MSKRQGRLLHRRKINNANRSVTPLRHSRPATRALRIRPGRSRPPPPYFSVAVRLAGKIRRGARAFPTRNTLSSARAAVWNVHNKPLFSGNFESLKYHVRPVLVVFFASWQKSSGGCRKFTLHLRRIRD